MNYFRNTLVCLGLLLLAACALLGSCLVWRNSAAQRRSDLETAAVAAQNAWEKRQAQFAQHGSDMPEIRRFLGAWSAQIQAGRAEQALILAMRTQLENLAQRRLGLVTDQALAPDPAKISQGKRAVWVQRVALRASGESIASLLTWLGEAESAYPLAHVEEWELVPGAGSGCALRLLLCMPLERLEPPSRKTASP
jgi:hypothetical protein